MRRLPDVLGQGQPHQSTAGELLLHQPSSYHLGRARLQQHPGDPGHDIVTVFSQHIALLENKNEGLILFLFHPDCMFLREEMSQSDYFSVITDRT